jgi:CheY-like chemotaxis protein
MTLVEQETLESSARSEFHVIVLVDDNPAVPAALRRALRGEPYTFFATTRPDVALDRIGRGGVSLVVMGRRMAGIGGPGLAERVRRISPVTVRVVLTPDAPRSPVLQGLADEVEWVVSKPWDDDSLRRAFRHLLRRHVPGDLPIPPPARIDWDRIECALRRVAEVFVQGTRWLAGFVWMADAGGK